MTTPPFIDVPMSICFASVSINLSHVVGVQASPFTKEEDRYNWDGTQWTITIDMPPTNLRGLAADWQAFNLLMEGRFGQCLFGDPSAKEPRGIATGTPKIDGGGQTGDSIITDGWTPSVNGILKKGDWIQLGSLTSSRLYMMTADVNSNGTGHATLPIKPGVRMPTIDNSDIIVHSARGVFRRDSNDVGWAVKPGKFWTFPTLTLVEVVNA